MFYSDDGDLIPIIREVLRGGRDMALALRSSPVCEQRETCLSDGKGTHTVLGFPLINTGDVTLNPSPGDKGDMAPGSWETPTWKGEKGEAHPEGIPSPESRHSFVLEECWSDGGVRTSAYWELLF